MTEKEEDEEPPPTSSGLDWEKLFKMAEDPDLEEIMQGPLEEALKQLQDEKEVPKLKAIRSLPTLLGSHGDECIEKLLPAIQQCLRDEKSNLDIHCEAAVVYKSIFQNEQLCQRFPGLIQLLLEHILSNVNNQKDNQSNPNRVTLQMGPVPQIRHLSAAAWLETLVEVAERVSLDAIRQYIVPVVQQQADPSQRVQRRVIAAKLLHKLADILPSDVVRKQLGPCAQQLCQDANSNVRTAMAQRLPTIAKALKNPTDCVSLLLPCFIQLCKDEDSGVQEACLNNLAECLPHFTSDAKRKTIIPLIRKTAELCLEKKDDTLPVVARHLGVWTHNLWPDLDKLDRSWVLTTYLRMVSESKAEASAASTQTNLKLTRRMSAFNLPCMVELFPKSFDRISPIFQSFCEDHDDEVRLAVAASFHELLERQSKRHQLLESFIDLIRGGAPEVVSKLTGNLDKTLPILYQLASEPGSKVTRVQLDRMILGCNQLLRGTGAWRAHESLLRHLVVLRQVLTISHIHETFVPLLKKEIAQVRAIPCRIAAVNSMLTFMREQPDAQKRLDIIQFFKTEIAGHKSCYRRLLYLDTAESVMRIFSRGFFVEHFLEEVIRLTHDNVSNVRLKAIRLLSVIKSCLILPDDDGKLLELEKLVGEALSKEKHTLTRQLLQSYACELSRCEARLRGDKEDARKVEEERILWSEERSKTIEEQEKSLSLSGSNSPSPKENTPGTPPSSSLRPPEGPVRAVSPWRSQRKAIAVVRPQPVVVMRASSPAPAARPSRLPMSIAARDKEASLKKSALESALPRPSARGSSVGRMPSTSPMSSSTSSLDSIPSSGYGLRKSATTTTGFGSFSSSMSCYPLMSSRSSSQIRRPTYGLTKVSSRSTLEKRPSQLKVRGVDS